MTFSDAGSVAHVADAASVGEIARQIPAEWMPAGTGPFLNLLSPP